jgi:hypothetical protein
MLSCLVSFYRRNETMKDDDNEALVTVDGAVKLIREEIGVPIPRSRLHRDSAAGRAPAPDMVYGKTYLYRPAKIRAYGRSLIKPPKTAA